jgi:hypothetical protein
MHDRTPDASLLSGGRKEPWKKTENQQGITNACI